MKTMKAFLSVLFVVFLASCNSSIDVPKPHVYPKVDYPEREYTPIKDVAPFQFEIPVYAELVETVDSKREKRADARFWRDLNYLPFDATLHISYSKIKGNNLDSLKEDSRKLAYEHSFKADDIQTIEMSKEQDKVYGNLYLIEGNTATNLNFFLTDSFNHFFRASLYFNQKTKPDSILPVFKFVKKDVEHLINTFKWK